MTLLTGATLATLPKGNADVLSCSRKNSYPMTRWANFSSDECSIFYVSIKMTRKFSVVPVPVILHAPRALLAVGANVKLTHRDATPSFGPGISAMETKKPGRYAIHSAGPNV